LPYGLTIKKDNGLSGARRTKQIDNINKPIYTTEGKPNVEKMTIAIELLTATTIHHRCFDNISL